MTDNIIPSSEDKSTPEDLRIYNIVSNAVIAAGSQPAGLLLLRIAFWNKHARISKHGKTWVVKTLAEWAAEGGLSIRQVTDAIPALVRRGLIEKTPGQFQGKRAAFVRLSDAGHTALDAQGPAKPKAPKSATVISFPAKEPAYYDNEPTGDELAEMIGNI